MGFYADALPKIRAALNARFDANGIESASTGGDEFSLMSLKDLAELELKYSRLAEEETSNQNPAFSFASFVK